MSGIAKGEIVVMEDQREFFCYKKIQDNSKTYLFMVSNFKPVEVFFAEEIIDGTGTHLRKVTDQAEKERLAPIFRMLMPKLTEEAAKKEPEPTRTLNGEVCEDSLAVGDGIVLDQLGEYFCFRKLRDGDREYLCLASKAKPRNFIFARETVVNGILSVNVVKDPERHNRLMAQLRKSPLEGLKQMFVKKPKQKESKD